MILYAAVVVLHKVLFDGADTIVDYHKKNPVYFEQAGPYEKIFFDPSKLRCAVVTCGGLCPGINDVIRALVMTLYYRYQVSEILGFQYGYQGFIESFGHEVLRLGPAEAADIHRFGGSILRSSRGPQDSKKIVDRLKSLGMNVLFVIGGDGTMRGADEIAEIAMKQGLDLSIIGIPKTIDNDILYIDQSFGFETAFSEAVRAFCWVRCSTTC